MNVKSWKTTASAVVTAAAGFVLASPELFTKYPWIVAVSKYVGIGGLVSLGVNAKDFNVSGQKVPSADADLAQPEGSFKKL